MKSNPFHAVIFTAIICIASGCSSSKHSLTYFEQLKKLPDGEMPVTIPQLRIVPDDALLITVNTEVPDASAPYNV
ncbi:MAG: polysaccharide export protein, partial [Muribaculaceae bacterium]|nr:polysaccharide export protein [Muribaculaceae bacterium]